MNWIIINYIQKIKKFLSYHLTPSLYYKDQIYCHFNKIFIYYPIVNLFTLITCLLYSNQILDLKFIMYYPIIIIKILCLKHVLLLNLPILWHYWQIECRQRTRYMAKHTNCLIISSNSTYVLSSKHFVFISIFMCIII